MKREKWCDGDRFGAVDTCSQGARYPELWGGCYGQVWYWLQTTAGPWAAAVYRPNGGAYVVQAAGGYGPGGLQGWVTRDGTPWQLTDAETYSLARTAHAPVGRVQYLSPIDPEDNETLYYLSLCRRTGFTLRLLEHAEPGTTRPEIVELGGLFAAPSGPRGGHALRLAEELGANRLACLGVGLRDWYEARDWFTYDAVSWDWTGEGETCYYLRKPR